LELHPLCGGGTVSLSDGFELSPSYFLGICFSERLSDCGFEILPSFVLAFSVGYGGFNLRPGISSTPRAGVVDLFGIPVELVGFAVEFKFALH
jgi:hypothetical protein